MDTSISELIANFIAKCSAFCWHAASRKTSHDNWLQCLFVLCRSNNGDEVNFFNDFYDIVQRSSTPSEVNGCEVSIVNMLTYINVKQY